MQKLQELFKTSLIGGLVVVLPVALLAFVFKWAFTFVTDLIQPLTDLIVAQASTKEILADFIVLLILIWGCFFVGLFVRTKLGTWAFQTVESKILKAAPGYTLIKETVLQFIGAKASPFSQVALVRIFQNETRVTAFVTDSHADGSYTVFVPTGPNPTSGNIYHVPAHSVEKVQVKVEDAMRSIIACGAGSTKLLIDANKKG